MSKVWMITGATRGFGKEFVLAALAGGDRVVATGRSRGALVELFGEDSDRVLTLALDVTRRAEAEAAVAAAAAHFGTIDVLVNNAGYALLGAVEEASGAELEDQFRTNVFGLVNVTGAVLPVMREQRRGHIFNLSSMAAIAPQAGSGHYSASKAAVEGLSASLADEVKGMGIAVTIVQPGYFRTDFLSPTSVKFTANEIGDYADTVGALRQFIPDVSGQQQGDPAKLAAALRTLAASDSPPLFFAVGADAVAGTEARLAEWRADLEAWRSLSCSTDFS